ncbi:hypothetical protein [Methanosphaerula subterraneus]|uniref:hypothetical protein n=1 Tax=Methanosphaerula subterraneus TaxID=3350244 RepID=UPI003F8456B3
MTLDQNETWVIKVGNEYPWPFGYKGQRCQVVGVGQGKGQSQGKGMINPTTGAVMYSVTFEMEEQNRQWTTPIIQTCDQMIFYPSWEGIKPNQKSVWFNLLTGDPAPVGVMDKWFHDLAGSSILVDGGQITEFKWWVEPVHHDEKIVQEIHRRI